MSAPVPGVVVVGGGLAAVSAVRGLRAAGYAGEVVLVSDETALPYDRPPLSKQFLAGAVSQDEIALFRGDELAGLSVTVRTGATAASVNVERREIRLDDGSAIAYAALVVATGAEARRLPLGEDLAGVHYLRSLDDATSLAEGLAAARDVVVIGAGFIGLEVAATARAAGVGVTVLEAAGVPLTRVLGHELGQVLSEVHVANGVALHCGATVTDIRGDGVVSTVHAVVAGEERSFRADLVVVGVGATPRTAWLDGSGVEVDDGVVCDSCGRTTVNGVYAAGDVSRWLNVGTGAHDRIEQWQAAQEQGAIVGANVAHDLGVPVEAQLRWTSVPYFWSDQYEHKIQLCGRAGLVSYARHTSRGWIAGFADEDSTVLCGVLAIDAPAVLARGRRHVAAGMTWADAVSWIDAL